ncbi:lipid asymmetry maintenance protein MlaB [Streptomyces sp. NBC_00102]|uniref:STAS domain-containing protein n=1 Tax=Streptomyces sp. NBC_00102 TaxID=2975652 RepID=UPI0022524517|nr:STAS domain-containing protein [Streptomyces sp. NBC_00102]MCX5399311.1 STAS domain-containing protein [Streptomyces sp. NBC_00102]
MGVEAAAPETVLVLTGRITRADVPELRAALERLLADPGRGPGPAECDLAGVVRPDLTTVEALARLSLTARRAGRGPLRLRGVPPELRTLLELVGLTDLAGLAVEAGPVAEAGPAVEAGPERRA